MIRKVIVSLWAMFAVCVTTAANINFKGSEAAGIGVYIAEISSGKVIVAQNVKRVFTPASTMKCVTAASAVMSLPASSPFTTSAEIRGTVRDNVLEGNLYITGGGDPTLDSRHFKTRECFAETVSGWLRSEGIDSIAGDIVIDTSVYPSIGVSPYWLLEDTPWEYGAGLYGINYRDNSFLMTVYPGEAVYDAPYDIEVVNRLKPGRQGDVMAMRGEGSSILTLTGTVAGSKGYTSRYSIPVPWMALYQDLESSLRQSGIGLGYNLDVADGGISKRIEHKSPLRDEILRVMMFKSDNLFAEGMLRALVLHEGGDRSIADAVKKERELLIAKGYDLSTLKISDGCGLAVTNRLSPEFLGSLLHDMSSNSGYVELFPKVGKEGTVARLLADTRLKGRLALKSGSMSGVLCYAGYKLDAGKRPTHVVVIMVNGFTCKVAEVRKAIASYLLTVF